MHEIQNSTKELPLNLKAQFASPSWLNGSRFQQHRWKLWIALAILLVVYFFKWGLSTERAIQCLLDRSIPSGRWIDDIASWPWMPVISIASSFLILWYAVGSFPVRQVRGRQGWIEIGYVGLVWAIPLVLTRSLLLITPESPCPSSASSRQFFELAQLGGPAEEVWFAAFVAIWMLIWDESPRVKLIGVTLGGGFLRGVFHVYQGWESLGLFTWGVAAALAVALTGRWFFLFLLHYVNNALITAGDLPSISAAIVVLFVCFITYVFARCLQRAPAERDEPSLRRR